MPIANCLSCSKEFRWMPSQTSGNYCSQECRITHTLEEKISSGNYTWANAKTYFKRNTEYKCSACGISEWNGKEIRLQIDHIDGNNANDKIENYRYLCPNCHTQTETWGVKNVSEDGRERLRKGGRNGRMKQME